MVGSYNLDEPLGKWFLASRHILHGCYRSRNVVHYHDEYACDKCKQRGTTRFYNIDYDTIEEPPYELYPTMFQMQPDGQLWIWKAFHPYQPSPPDDERMVIVDEYVEQPDDKLIIASDASVHVANDAVAGA